MIEGTGSLHPQGILMPRAEYLLETSNLKMDENGMLQKSAKGSLLMCSLLRPPATRFEMMM
jgi:hypothetical protein